MLRFTATPRHLLVAFVASFCAAGPAIADEDVGTATSELKVAPEKPKLYRLKLKNGDRYLDHGCGKQVVVRSGGRRNDPCQLWRVVKQGPGWFRLQTANANRFLDAEHCTANVGLSGHSDWEGGACQAWRLAGNYGGWSRLQLRHGNHYLDAAYCKEKVGMHPGSTYDGGSCQLWRLVPE